MEWWGWIGVWGLVWLVLGSVLVNIFAGEKYDRDDIKSGLLVSALLTAIISAIVHHFIK